MSIQYLFVFIVLALAVAYAAYRLWRTLRDPGCTPSACDGCPLAKGCKKVEKP